LGDLEAGVEVEDADFDQGGAGWAGGVRSWPPLVEVHDGLPVHQSDETGKV